MPLSFRHLLFLCLFLWNFVCQALILDAPKPPSGFSAILVNGSMSITWAVEANDPTTFTLELSNNVTGDTWIWIQDVSASALSASGKLPDDTPGSPWYSVAATFGARNVNNPLASSPVFVIAGEEPATTDPDLFTTTSSSSRLSIIGATTSPATVTDSPESSSSLSPGIAPQETGTSTPSLSSGPNVGVVAGAVVGGLLVLLLILSLIWLYLRRRRLRMRARYNGFEIDSSEEQPSSYTDAPQHAHISPLDLTSSASLPPVMSSKSTEKSIRMGQLAVPIPHSTSNLSSADVSSSSASSTRNLTNSASQNTREDPNELRLRLEQMQNRVRLLEEERAMWGDVPPDYVSSAGDLEQRPYPSR